MRFVSLLSLVLALGGTVTGCGVLFQVQAPSTYASATVVVSDKTQEVEAPSPFGALVDGESQVEGAAAGARVSVAASVTVSGGTVLGGEALLEGDPFGRGALDVARVDDDLGGAGVDLGAGSPGRASSSDARAARRLGAEGDGSSVEGASDGGASLEGGRRGDVLEDAHVSGEVDGQPVVDPGVRAAGGLDVEVDLALRGTPGVPAEELGGGVGVRAAPSASGARTPSRANLGALVTAAGVNVDGFRTRLGDLGPLAPRMLEAESRAGVAVPTDGRVDVRVELAHAQLPRAGGETELVVRLRGGERDEAARSRVRVHLVIDRSSSMRGSWPEVLAAAAALVDQLAARDELHVVAYDAHATTVVPLGVVGDGRRAKRAIAELGVGGGTNIEVGLRAAYESARRAHDDVTPLVVLLSDGVPNGGAYSADELAPMAAQASARLGCSTTVVGLGDGFDADVLRAIAFAGGGGYHVAANAGDLGAVLRAEVRAQQRVAARAVELAVALPDGVELSEAPEVVASEDASLRFTFPQLREGEERRVVLRVRVRGGVETAGTVSVRYRGRGGAVVVGRRDVGLRFGERAISSGGAATFAVADADLGGALDVAASHLRDGRVAEAKATLEAQARMQLRAPQPELRVRAEATLRFAAGLGVLAADASWTARREVALAMGGLAVRLRR